MSELEKRYTEFALDENMREKFRQFSVGVQEKNNVEGSLVITTVVIDHSGKHTFIKDGR